MVGAAAMGGMVVALLAGCTPALVRDVAIEGRLGAEGGSVDVIVTFKCNPEWNIAFGSLRLIQSDDGRLAQGTGGFSKVFPGVPCTGRTQGVKYSVLNFSPWSFDDGDAAVEGNLVVFDPVNGVLTETTIDQEIEIVDEDPRPVPTSSGRQTPDARYPDL
jgi:hypothetical protein